MEIFLGWIIFCAIVGAIATDRAMGFWGGFLWSFFLSPIIGFFIVMFSKSKAAKDHETQMYYAQQQQSMLLHQMQQQNQKAQQTSIADELAKLKSQLDQGVITEQEFQLLKSKMIS